VDQCRKVMPAGQRRTAWVDKGEQVRREQNGAEMYNETKRTKGSQNTTSKLKSEKHLEKAELVVARKGFWGERRETQ